MGLFDIFKKKSSATPDRNDSSKEEIFRKEGAQNGGGPAFDPFGGSGAQGNMKPLYMVSELGRALYQIEHVGLRDHFFNDPESVLAMVSKKDGIFDFINFVLMKNGIKNPYRASDFSVNGLKIDEDNSLILIEFPEPEFTPLVYRMYFAFNKTFTKKEIYTIEAAVNGGAFLCKWSGQDHTNINRVAEPSRKKQHGIMQVMEIKIVSELFLKGKI